MSVVAKTSRERKLSPQNLRKGGAEAGVLSGSAAGEGGASLVEIAVWNEFGTERAGKDGTKKNHIPARPFMRSTATEKEREWRALVARVCRLVLEGQIDVDTASEILGQQMQADIQQKITDLRDPPNAKSTRERKGSDNPLIDTGALQNSIKYQVINS